MLDEPEIETLCGRFAMEVAKVVNFYNFSNPERQIEQLYFLGGGARIMQLTNAISESVSVPVDTVASLLPFKTNNYEDVPVCALAAAGMLEGEAM